MNRGIMSTLVVCIALVLAVPVMGAEADPVSWPAITSDNASDWPVFEAGQTHLNASEIRRNLNTRFAQVAKNAKGGG